MRLKAAQGHSLIEVLISMTLGVIILAAAAALLIANTHFGVRQLQQDFLRTELSTLAYTIFNEIQRAGFCFYCIKNNPYHLVDKNNHSSAILINDSASQSKGSCIRFAYNHNKRSRPRLIDKDDAKGFRLGKDPNGKPVIEIYENRDGLSNWHCHHSAGYAGYWQDMTIDELVIEEFLFSRKAFLAGKNLVQSITLKISASIKGNKKIKETLTLKINVPNVDG